MNYILSLWILVFFAILFRAELSNATGYEMPIQYSAEYSPLSAAVTSFVKGAQSMTFNIAGMAGTKDSEIELTVAPLFSKKKGAYIQDVQTESNWEKAFPATLNLKYGINEKLAVGLGTTYLGTSLNKEHQDYSSIHSSFIHYQPSEKQQFMDAEITIGIAYSPFAALKLGFGWRMAIMTGHLESNSISIFDENSLSPGFPSQKIYGLSHLELDKLKDTSFSGFRFGFQYIPSPKTWGIGAAFRSKLNYQLKGKIQGKVYYSSPFATGLASEADLIQENVVMKSHVPMQIQLGAHYYIRQNWVGLFNYSFTQYSKMGVIGYNGNITIPETILGTINRIQLPNIATHWKDFHTIALASEYENRDGWILRSGIIYMSQVVDNYSGSFSTVTPGAGVGATAGLGKKNFRKNLDLNLGIAYAKFKGRIKKSDQNLNRPTIGGSSNPHPSYDGLNGKFSTQSIIALLGGVYHF